MLNQVQNDRDLIGRPFFMQSAGERRINMDLTEIKCIQTGVFRVNTYIVPCGENKVFVVDPAACAFSGDENKITLYLEKNHLECTAILLTHCHFDHITGILPIKRMFPDVKIAISAIDAPELGLGKVNSYACRYMDLQLLEPVLEAQPKANLLLQEGDDFYGWKVLETPGHTAGSICLYQKESNRLISGDTIFHVGYGRTDLPTGNEDEMMKTLQRLGKEMPRDIKLYPGH